MDSKRLRVAWGLLGGLALIALCGCPDAVDEIGGVVEAGFPLSTARLSVLTAENPLESTTDNAGYWGPVTLIDWRAPFRIEAQGGQLNGAAFEGMLSAYCPLRDLAAELSGAAPSAWDAIAITPLSSCIDRYMRVSGLSYPEAAADVAAFFALPPEVNIALESPDSRDFDPVRFLEAAEAYGDFDAFVDTLVLRMGGSDSEWMGASAENDLVFDLAKYTIPMVGFNFLLGLAGGQIGDQIFSFALAALGIESYEDGIERNLKEIMEELEVMREEINVLSNSSKWLLDGVNLARDKILKQLVESEMRPHLSIINNQYENFTYIDEENPASAQSFVKNMKYDLYQELIHINEILTSSPESNLLMLLSNLLTNDVIAAEADPSVLKKSYCTLEQYFGNLVAVQMKGMFLELNLINYQAALDNKNYTGSAEAFVAEFYENLTTQVDYFLMAVERLVVSAADVRTVVVGNYAMFPAEAVQEIFARADFYASRLSSRHEARLSIRLIGDQEVIESCLKSKLLNAPQFGEPQAVALPEKGSAIRSYAIPIPDHYEVQAYLSWKERLSGGWAFKVRDTIAVAKLHFPDQNPPFGPEHRAQAPYSRTYTFPQHLKARVRYVLRDPVSGAETDASDPKAIFSGHGVFIARNLPHFETPETTLQENPTFDGEQATDALRAQYWTRYTLLDKYKFSFLGYNKESMNSSAAFSFRAQNDSGSEQRIRFDCAAWGSADARNNFERAATQSYWDSTHFLYLQLQWQLWVDTVKALHYNAEAGASGGAFATATYPRYLEKNYENDKASEVWKSGVTRTVKSAASRNLIHAYARTTWDPLSDKGSKVAFQQGLDYLELIPE